jgi:hypothetical protein
MTDIKVTKVQSDKPTILINFILDESGSMLHQRQQVIDGFNEYVQDHKLKEDAEYLISLTKFSSKPEVVFVAKPVAEVRPLGDYDYRPSGSTALRDAIGHMVIQTDGRISLMKEKPKVLTFIFTDGEENSSQEFKDESINSLITQRENGGYWTFTFIGASKECLKQAQKYGIQSGNTIWYNSNNYVGTVAAMSAATTAYVSNSILRSSGHTDSFFKEANINSTADIDTLGAKVIQERVLRSTTKKD